MDLDGPRLFLGTAPARSVVLLVLLMVAVSGCSQAAGVADGGSASSVRSPASQGAPRTTLSSAPTNDPQDLMKITWWLARAVVSGRTYDSPQPKGNSEFGSYTVQFIDHHIDANDTCNTINASVTVDTHELRNFDSVSSTLVGCSPESELRRAYDQELFQGSVRWTLDGGRLRLTTANGDIFEYEPWPAGYPSDLAGRAHATTPEGSVDGVKFRIFALPLDSGGNQCLVMEFHSPAGTPWESVRVCRDNLATKFVVNPTDFTAGRLPSGSSLMFGAVPNGSATQIVFRPSDNGPVTNLALMPLPGTRFRAFYGIVERAHSGGTVAFYDEKGNPFSSTWAVSWS